MSHRQELKFECYLTFIVAILFLIAGGEKISTLIASLLSLITSLITGYQWYQAWLKETN
jgi:hypothetical protein